MVFLVMVDRRPWTRLGIARLDESLVFRMNSCEGPGPHPGVHLSHRAEGVLHCMRTYGFAAGSDEGAGSQTLREDLQDGDAIDREVERVHRDSSQKACHLTQEEEAFPTLTRCLETRVRVAVWTAPQSVLSWWRVTGSRAATGMHVDSVIKVC